MKNNSLKRIGAGLAAAIVGCGMLLGSGITQPAAAQATERAECTITGGQLSWGIKESFRSYISGTIANGSWETSDGASYATPLFDFSGGTGTYDPATESGTVNFSGSVHFTGHDGILDLTIANPTIEFDGAGEAALLVDMRSTNMEGEQAIDEKQVWLGKITGARLTAAGEKSAAFKDAPTTLTDSGAAAFAGFYKAGQELDPVTVQLGVSEGCTLAAGEDTADSAQPAKAKNSSDSSDTAKRADAANAGTGIPVLPAVIAAIALVVIIVTLILLLRGRKSDTGPISETVDEPQE